MGFNESKFGRAMKKELLKEEQQTLAEFIRNECVKTALEAYEEASIRGLCHEGAWEYAIDSMRNLKVEDILKKNSETKK
jgi:hypothetical protein